MSGTDMIRPEDVAAHGFELAERVFTEQRRVQVAQFLNIEPSDPVLVPYLVAAATYGLSPIMGEMWLVPYRATVRDGSGARTKVDRYRPAVTRDGFLSIARRDRRYLGLQGAVMCEHDSYDVSYSGDVMSDPIVVHRWASKPTVFEDGEDPERWRGRPLLAWAKCFVQGQPPVFFEARLREYARREQRWSWGAGKGERVLWWLDDEGRETSAHTGRPAVVWAGAWGYLTGMLLKSAQSYVLRTAFGITGLVPLDEMAHELAPPPDASAWSTVQASASAATSDGFDWSRLTCSPEMAVRVREAVEAANALSPMSWSPAKCEMVLVGVDDATLERTVEGIEREVALHSQRVDPPPSEVTEVEGEQATDAEVLSDGEARIVEAMREHPPGSEEHEALAVELAALRAEPPAE